VRGGDLRAKITRKAQSGGFFDENLVWAWFIQCVEGIAALHRENIVHRDLKTSNVFVTHDGRVKIGDLGVSKVNIEFFFF
jgi:serine/threonine protein kinase